jgi:hypothetical protein
MKKILVTLVFILFTSNTLYAAKPCTKAGGLLKVSDYEECMKDPNRNTKDKTLSKLKALGEKKKKFDDENKTLVDMLFKKK